MDNFKLLTLTLSVFVSSVFGVYFASAFSGPGSWANGSSFMDLSGKMQHQRSVPSQSSSSHKIRIFRPEDWNPEWNGTKFVAPGATISSQELGQNLQFLYDKLSELGNFSNCNFQIVEGLSCKYPYNCKCGKYGCSVCMGDGIQSRLDIECPNQPKKQFFGACQDQRQAQKCGKYGCK